MMVDDDHVEAGRLAAASASALVVPQSTVTISLAPRDDKFAHRLRIGPVAFEEAVGNVDLRRGREVRQEARHQCRRSRAVDVIVAEDRHLLLAPSPLGDTRGRLVHVGQRGRIRHQDAERGSRKGSAASAARRARPEPVPRYRAAKSLGDAQAPRSPADRSRRSIQGGPVADRPTPRKVRLPPVMIRRDNRPSLQAICDGVTGNCQNLSRSLCSRLDPAHGARRVTASPPCG